jgi:hypothetical protein
VCSGAADAVEAETAGVRVEPAALLDRGNRERALERAAAVEGTRHQLDGSERRRRNAAGPDEVDNTLAVRPNRAKLTPSRHVRVGRLRNLPLLPRLAAVG